MAGPYVLRKYYGQNLSLDTSTPSIMGNPAGCSVLDNVKYECGIDGEAITSRPGYKVRAQVTSNRALFTYPSNSELISLGATTERIGFPILGNDFRIKYDETIDAAVTGYALIEVSIELESGTWRFKIDADSSNILNYDMGTGFEGTPKTLTNLKTAVDALDDFELSVSSVIAGSPAAFAAAFEPTQIFDATGFDMSYYAVEEIERRVGTSISGSNAHGVHLGENLYIMSSDLLRYDGVSITRAGAIKPTVATAVVDGGGGSMSAGDYSYIFTTVVVDANGNRWESEPVDTPDSLLNITVAGSKSVNVAVNFDDISQQYNLGYAVVSATDTGVTTISCDDGSGGDHNLLVGDIAYFYDGSTDTYVEREIEAVTGTTIDIAGAAVDVTDGDHISPNTRVAIYRTKLGGSSYYLTGKTTANGPAEYPLAQDTASLTRGTYNDQLVDADLGAEYLFPLKPHTETPRLLTALTTHQGLLVCIAGQYLGETVERQVFFSEPGTGNLEFFPATNRFLVGDITQGSLTGLVSFDNVLYVFRSYGIWRVHGSLANDSFTVVPLSLEVGTVAHNTIRISNDGIIFLAQNTVYLLRGSQLVDIGKPICAFIQAAPQDGGAFGFIDPFERVYILTINAPANVPALTESKRTFAYDLDRGRWSEYTTDDPDTDFEITAMAIKGSNLAWLSKGSLSSGGSICEFMPREGLGLASEAFPGNKRRVDHVTGIPLRIVTGHENLGEPDSLKSFTRTRVHAPLDGETTSTSVRFRTQLDYTDTTHTDTTVALDGLANTNRAEFPMSQKKAEALRYEITHSTVYEQPKISGWTTEIAVPHRPKLGANDGDN